MENVTAIAFIAVIVGVAVAYIVRAKKKGVKCIGCPNGGKCGSCGGNCHCDGSGENE